MITAIVVDDDRAFLDSLRDVPLRGLTLELFADPIQAIKSLKKIQPAILISDVHMPGVHGLDFCFIAQEIVAHRHVVLISANSLEDVEARFGAIGNARFFQKPLDEGFFHALEDLAANLKKQAALPPLDPAESAALSQRLDHAGVLFDYWRERDEFVFAHLRDHSFVAPLPDEYWATLKVLDTKVESAREALRLSPAQLDRAVGQFSRRHAPWYDRVLQDLGTLAAPCEVEAPHAFKIVDPSDKNAGRVLEVKRFALRRDGSDLSLTLNNDVHLVRSLSSYERERRAREALRAAALFRTLRSELDRQSTAYVRRFWQPPLPPDARGEIGEAVFDDVWCLANGLRLVSVTWQTGSTPFEVLRIGRTDTGDSLLLDEASLATIPARLTLKARRSLALEFDAATLQLRLARGRKDMPIPLDELVHEELARGFKTRDTAYAKADLAIAYAWRWALGQAAPLGETWRRLVG